MSDWVKLPVALLAYLVLAPALGLWLREHRSWQRWLFALLIFMTSWHINQIIFMVGSVEWYRGHTKGYEVSYLEVLALALLVATGGAKGRGSGWLWGSWLLYVGLSMLSITAAPRPDFVWMCLVKFGKAALLLAAAVAYLRREEELDWALRAVAFTLVVQMVVVLHSKYGQGIYQVRGWFEHQNPLAMWAYMLGLPLLGAALTDCGRERTRWYALGFAASAVIIQSALSRAALLMFAAGAVGIMVISIATRPTLKKAGFAAALGLLAVVALALSLDTIIKRFNDDGNQASKETREVMNLASKAMLQASPVGIGWNNYALCINAPFPYGDVIDDQTRAKGHKVDEDYPKGVVESHYWLLLGETGYVGTLGYVFFLALSGWAVLQAWWRWRKHWVGGFLLGLLVALALTYFQSNYERVLTQTKNLAAWLLLLGLAWALRQGPPTQRNSWHLGKN